MQISAATPSAYLAALPPERRAAIARVRSVIRKNLPKGYKESVGWGMLVYVVPLSRYPGTYNGQPACYVALAAQKNYCSLYLMSVYMDRAESARLKEAFEQGGKKLDMGKSCVRFTEADDLPLDTIGSLVAGTSVDDFVARCEASRHRKPRRGGSSRAASR